MRFKFINLEDMVDESRICTNPKPLNKEKKFSEDGIFSEEFFGKNNDNEEMLSYSCECGKTKGKFLKGYKCPDCGTIVQFKESFLDRFAWISLGDYYIISPIFFHLLAKLLGGTTHLNSIISYDKKIDRDGEIDEETSKNEKSQFYNMGLVEFKNNLFEGKKLIKDFYKLSKNKEKKEIVELILKNRDKVFLNHIPVYDTLLRPCQIQMGGDKPTFRFDEINNSFNFIIQLSNMINKKDEIDLIVLPNLYEIQNKANVIYEKLINNISGKTGFIRSSILGTRCNFSSRCVITPLPPGHSIDEITIPYIVFLELYSFHLLNMLSKLKNISLIEAEKILFKAKINFDPEVYQLCKELIKKTKGGLKAIVNRNPTIARGSIQVFRVTDVKNNTNDLTFSVNNVILELFNGDLTLGPSLQ